MKAMIPPKFASNPLFMEVLKEGLAVQDRFSPEPVYAKTGKGYLKSAGVDEIKPVLELQRAHGPAASD